MENQTENEDSGDESESKKDWIQAGREQRTDLIAELARLQATVELSIEIFRENATLMYGRYKALRDAGFDETQTMTFMVNRLF